MRAKERREEREKRDSGQARRCCPYLIYAIGGMDISSNSSSWPTYISQSSNTGSSEDLSSSPSLNHTKAGQESKATKAAR